MNGAKFLSFICWHCLFYNLLDVIKYWIFKINISS